MGFEPQISDVMGKFSTICAIITALLIFCLAENISILGWLTLQRRCQLVYMTSIWLSNCQVSYCPMPQSMQVWKHCLLSNLECPCLFPDFQCTATTARFSPTTSSGSSSSARMGSKSENKLCFRGHSFVFDAFYKNHDVLGIFCEECYRHHHRFENTFSRQIGTPRLQNCNSLILGMLSHATLSLNI